MLWLVMGLQKKLRLWGLFKTTASFRDSSCYMSREARGEQEAASAASRDRSARSGAVSTGRRMPLAPKSGNIVEKKPSSLSPRSGSTYLQHLSSSRSATSSHNRARALTPVTGAALRKQISRANPVRTVASFAVEMNGLQSIESPVRTTRPLILHYAALSPLFDASYICP